MYRKSFRFKRHSHGQFGFKRNFGGNRGFRQKIFDPSNVIQNSVMSEPEKEYVAKNSFGDFLISEKLRSNIISRGYKTPTPIQDQAIVELLNGRDIVGIAATGTGKTAAFLIPLIDKVLKNHSEKVLIIAPTRELAVQIEEELIQFSRGLNIFSALCIGGVSLGGQIRKLYQNPQFVIGTPGRLKDLENQRRLNFQRFRTIVLDEVDRMLDMGFIQDMNYIIDSLPQDRHSLFFSATITSQVESVMSKFLRNPVIVKVASIAPANNVAQEMIRLNGKPKIEVLHSLLINDDFKKVLVFGRTKFGIEKLSKELIGRGFKVASIHGNKSQNQRQRALSDFKRNFIQILLATDLASRGLDISDVTHVINYELPESYEAYIHRIGRTGRANKKGKAITFVN